MHYQIHPYAEVKLVRCSAGVVYDVIIDLRLGSPTFMQWSALELSAENHKLLYIPEGFAHGFQTLADNTELIYQHSTFHSPGHEKGIRFDDPALNIAWPLPVSMISPKDQHYSLINCAFKGMNT